eukprot:TRINITY_DN73497_c0_g1_i1.p1 TRINITY_DN73497_c0_g1~~TRINITY_DN73497_c0_g1_i1.p1  ORF type:complete len:273 (-),score=24.86 TRINITY_DN73497_c0_g1_i1:104-922(-)
MEFRRVLFRSFCLLMFLRGSGTRLRCVSMKLHSGVTLIALSLAATYAILGALEMSEDDVGSVPRRMQDLPPTAARSIRLVRLFVDYGGPLGMAVRLGIYACYGIVASVFAVLYKRMVVDKVPAVPQPPPTLANDFGSSIFGCCGNTQLSLHACCCLACRASHTWHVAGVVDYWAAVFGLCFCTPCMCFVGGYFRSRLRKQLKLAPGGLTDFLVWIPCCGPCAAGQEAMQVDAISGLEVACCCRAQMLPPSVPGPGSSAAVVGNPVRVAACNE